MTTKLELTILIVGDVFVLRDDPRSVFKHVKELMRSADFMLGNLEGSVCDVGKAVDKLGSEAWKADSRQLSAIQAAGFHAMNVANNHMMDFGNEAMLATIDNLDRIGVKHSGGGAQLCRSARASNRGTRRLQGRDAGLHVRVHGQMGGGTEQRGTRSRGCTHVVRAA